jgi:hypothetical protein
MIPLAMTRKNVDMAYNDYMSKHLIVLPGNSQKNKTWGELMVDAFSPHFDSVYMLSYDHWETGDTLINFEIEEEKLREYVASLPPQTDITLFAKSAGSLLGFLSVAHNVLRPSRCAFFGIPFDLAVDGVCKDGWDIVDTFTIPAIAFHNVDDPTTSYNYTKNILARHAPQIELVTTHESDHWYGDIATYTPHLF